MSDITEQAFFTMCANVINTSWKHSWYWDRDGGGFGGLSGRGHEQALNDCRGEKLEAEIRASSLEAIESCLMGVITREEAQRRLKNIETTVMRRRLDEKPRHPTTEEQWEAWAKFWMPKLDAAIHRGINVEEMMRRATPKGDEG